MGSRDGISVPPSEEGLGDGTAAEVEHPAADAAISKRKHFQAFISPPYGNGSPRAKASQISRSPTSRLTLWPRPRHDRGEHVPSRAAKTRWPASNAAQPHLLKVGPTLEP